jgi:hypothetical protein
MGQESYYFFAMAANDSNKPSISLIFMATSVFNFNEAIIQATQLKCVVCQIKDLCMLN